MKMQQNIGRKVVLGAMLALATVLSGCARPAPKPAVPELKILYNTEEESAEKSAIAQTLQSQLGQAGIRVTLDPVANSVFYQRVGAGDFQCALA